MTIYMTTTDVVVMATVPPSPPPVGVVGMTMTGDDENNNVGQLVWDGE
jgi:hypothetical protein